MDSSSPWSFAFWTALPAMWQTSSQYDTSTSVKAPSARANSIVPIAWPFDTNGRTIAAVSPWSRSQPCSLEVFGGVTHHHAERPLFLEHLPGGRVFVEPRVDLSGRHRQAEIHVLQVSQRHQDVALAIPERDRGAYRAGRVDRRRHQVLGQRAQVEA